MDRVSKATGARVQTTVNGLNPVVLGTCAAFEEKQVCGKGVFIRGGGGAACNGRVHVCVGALLCADTLVQSR